MVAVKLLVCLVIVVPVVSEVYHAMSTDMYNNYVQPNYGGGLYGMSDYDMYDFSRDNYMDAVQNRYQMNMLTGLNNGYGFLGYNSYPMSQQYPQQYQGMNTVGQTVTVGNTVQNVPMSQVTGTNLPANDHASAVADVIRSILAGHSGHQNNAVRKYVVI